VKILILGAAGQVSRILTEKLLDRTNHDLVLFGRNVTSRLSQHEGNNQVKLVDGDFRETDKLKTAMKEIDLVYLNDMSSAEAVESIVEAMDTQNVKRFIAATVLNIYGEVTGEFRKYTDRMVGAFIPPFTETAEIVEESDLDYTLMRLPWLYNDETKKEVHLTEKGEALGGTQISRHAIAEFVVEMIETDDAKHYNQSYGVSEPNTDWDCPSFRGFR